MNEENNLNQGNSPQQPGAPQPPAQPPQPTEPVAPPPSPEQSTQAYQPGQQAEQATQAYQAPPAQPPIGGAPSQQPYPAYGAPAPSQPSSGKALAALLCGIFAILLSGTIFFGIVLGIIAIVLAGQYVKSFGKDSKATGGKICGIIGIILSVIALIFYIVFFVAAASFSNAIVEEYGSSDSYSYVAPDNSDSDEYADEESSDLDAETLNITVADDDICTILVTGKGVDWLEYPGYFMEITNNTDRPIYVTYGYGTFSVAGKMVDPGFWESIQPGKYVETFLYFDPEKVGSIDELTEVEGVIIVEDDETYEEIASYNVSLT